MAVTVDQIAALSDWQAESVAARPEVSGYVRKHLGPSSNTYRDAIFKAYMAAGQVAPADRLFAAAFQQIGPLYEGMMPTYLSNDQVAKAAPIVEAAVAAFNPEMKAVYTAFRFGLHLGNAVYHQFGNEALNAVQPPLPRLAATDSLPEVVMRWAVPAEAKLQGLDLLADMSLICRPYTSSFLQPSTRSARRSTQVWQHVLGEDNSMVAIKAYMFTRAYFAHAKYLQQHPEEAKKYEFKWPGAMVPSTGKALVENIAGSIYAHLQRGLVSLVQPGQSYLEYVLRVLQNYVYYGVASLQPSDLLEDDDVFSLAAGSIVPDDTTILQRLASL